MRKLLLPYFIPFLFLIVSPPTFSERISDSSKQEMDAEYYSSPSLRRMRIGLLDKYDPKVTCEKFPRICRAKGSGGPDCCKRRCVNVMADGVNCGECGKRCGYGEKCCGGRCVNVGFDGENCGACHSRCKKGMSFCHYGMCSYAS